MITGIVSDQDWTERQREELQLQSSLNLDIPVKYIGVGESIDDLQKFDADQFVNALFDVRTEDVNE